MAYSEELAEVVERKMFGRIAWMVNGNMACGIIGEDLMVRLDRDDTEAAQAEEHAGPMEFHRQGTIEGSDGAARLHFMSRP